jgi:hypothetical protein
MKQILLLIASLMVVMSSCNKDESVLSQSDEIVYLEDNYETMLKGYSVAGPKVETVGIGMSEDAEKFFNKVQEILDGTYSKSGVSTRAGYGLKVGIFKYFTCGSYPEFHYHQDNQDGGYTKINNVVGATTVDSNKNLNWKFCIVPGTVSNGESLRSYGGGVLLLSNYTWTTVDGLVHVYERFHDDEDNSNQNQITQLGGLTQEADGHVGTSWFDSNTGFVWLFKDTETRSKDMQLGFVYGIIAWGMTTNDYNSLIDIDDEDSKNDNHLKHKIYTTSANPYIYSTGDFAGIGGSGRNTIYYVKYF